MYYKILLLSCVLTLGLILSAHSQFVSFNTKELDFSKLNNPTSLQFGPDQRLYVAQQNGLIHVLEINRTENGTYEVIVDETIDLIQKIPNHNDDGVYNPTINTRQVTGILVSGSANDPIIYVTSSDPRIGGGGKADLNLDTNSGIISKLYIENDEWKKIDIVRGLPRSEENHSLNGLDFHPSKNMLLVTSGGNTNKGAPSNNFTFLPEYALAAAVLSVDLDALENMPVLIDQYGDEYIYDLPTLDDEDRVNISQKIGYEDQNDPFGGNNGKNQARLIVNGPVQVYSSGWRNVYDIVVSDNGKIYTYDNGPNSGWGGTPAAGCTNEVNENNSKTEYDNLHHIAYEGYYGGHPNPTRANRNNTFNPSNPQSPVDPGLEDPSCQYLVPETQDGALATHPYSTNGIALYKATNFNSTMLGDLLAVTFDNKLLRYHLSEEGNSLIGPKETVLASDFGIIPLDVTTQGDFDKFPGTIWVCNYVSDNITILDPNDFNIQTCLLENPQNDDDGDGYSNDDEELNGTNPCNPAHTPRDFDKDFISNALDPDDDNDNLLDLEDFFPLDPANGKNTGFPVIYDFDNSNDGGINGWGFTGLMSNGEVNYRDLFDEAKMTVGGAGLKFTIDEITDGTALNDLNNQFNAFQFGFDYDNAPDLFQVVSRIQGSFSTVESLFNQSYGFFIGTGDQDNYISLEIGGQNGELGFKIIEELNGTSSGTFITTSIMDDDFLDLKIAIDKINEIAIFSFSTDGEHFNFLTTKSLNESIFKEIIAIGIIGSSGQLDTSFIGTWDFIHVEHFDNSFSGDWNITSSNNNSIERHENGALRVANKFVSLGGRGIKPVSIYDIQQNSWSQGNPPPIELHHFQAVEYNNLIYIAGAFTGNFPGEDPVEDIYIYDVFQDRWSKGPRIERPRGSAGAVIVDDYLYLISGILDGHQSGWVQWVDRMNLITNEWETLSDIPNPRDHFFASYHDEKVYIVGGRRSGQINTFSPTITAVDIYDINDNTWLNQGQDDLPTGRAGAFGGILFNELIVAGGEDENQARSETEAFDLNTLTWRQLGNLQDSRHGTQAIIFNNKAYVPNGSGDKGGGPELTSMEVFAFDITIEDEDFEPIEIPNITLIQDTFRISANKEDEIQLNIINESDETPAFITDLILPEGLSISNLQMPIRINPAAETILNLKLDYVLGEASISTLQLIFGGLIDPIQVVVMRASKSPKIYAYNFGGGDELVDNVLFFKGPDIPTYNEITNDLDLEIPFGTAIEGRDIHYELSLPNGYYELTLFGDTIGLEHTSISTSVSIENINLPNEWVIDGSSGENISYSTFTYIQDQSLDFQLNTEYFQISGIKIEPIPPYELSFNTLEDEVLLMENDQIIENIEAGNETFSFQILKTPDKGILKNSDTPLSSIDYELSNFVLTYEPNLNSNGTDIFEYLIKIDGVPSYYRKAFIHVAAANDPITLKENQSAQIAIDEDDIRFLSINTFINNPDRDNLIIEFLNNDIQSWIELNNGILKIEPTNNEVGNNTVQLLIKDENDTEIFLSFQIDVINVNDAPIKTIDVQDSEIYEDEIYEFIFDDSSFYDIDKSDKLSYTITLNGENVPEQSGITENGFFIKGSKSMIGQIQATVEAIDMAGISVSESFNLTILDRPEHPVFTIPDMNLAISEDSTAILSFNENQLTDNDLNEIIVLSLSSEVDWIHVENKTLFLTPTNMQVGEHNFTLYATDKFGLKDSIDLNVNVGNVNDAPFFIEDFPAITVFEDSILSLPLDLYYSDIDLNDEIAVSYEIDESISDGQFLQLEDSDLIITPKNEDVGNHKFKIIVSDAEGETATQLLNITVVNTNDPPELVSIIEDILVDDDSIFTILIDESLVVDPDLNELLSFELSIDVDTIPSWIELIDNLLVINPPNAFEGIYPITLIISDQVGEYVEIEFRLTIKDFNSPPTGGDFALDGYNKVNSNLPLTDFFSLLHDSDETQFIGVSFTELPKNGNISINQSLAIIDSTYNVGIIDSITYRPEDEFVGQDTVKYRVYDGDRFSTETFNIIFDIAKNPILNAREIVLSNIKLFPNPFSNILHIEISNHYRNSDTEIVLRTITGQLIMVIKESRNKLQLDLNHLPNGVYLLQIGNSVKKVVKSG